MTLGRLFRKTKHIALIHTIVRSLSPPVYLCTYSKQFFVYCRRVESDEMN